MRSRLSAPLIVDFNVTNMCNLQCEFCYANASNSIDSKEMDLKLIDSIFKQFEDMHVHVVRITGGEPFARKDICLILEMAHKYSFLLCINTNGTLINEEILLKLKHPQIVSVAVSLDAGNETIHNRIRGRKDAFSNTTSNIAQLVKTLSNDIVSTTYTLTALNADIITLKETIEYNKSLGINKMSLQMMAPVGRGVRNNNINMSYEQWKQIFLFVTEYKLREKEFEIKINPMNEADICWEYYFPLKQSEQMYLLESIWNQKQDTEQEMKYISCVAGHYVIAVSADGKVYPCELMMGNPELCVGDLNVDLFKEIWNNSEILNEIHNIEMKDLTSECVNCTLTFCGGGCRAVAYASNHNLYSCDVRCPNTMKDTNIYK